jgi:hypothetical protein
MRGASTYWLPLPCPFPTSELRPSISENPLSQLWISWRFSPVDLQSSAVVNDPELAALPTLTGLNSPSQLATSWRMNFPQAASEQATSKQRIRRIFPLFGV